MGVGAFVIGLSQISSFFSSKIMFACYLAIEISCVFLALQQNVLSNKKEIFIETTVSVMLLKFVLGQNINYMLNIPNGPIILRETFVTFCCNHVTFI